MPSLSTVREPRSAVICLADGDHE